MAARWFPILTDGKQTWTEIDEPTTKDLVGAATGTATAAAQLDFIVISGAMGLPPESLIGAARSVLTAEADLFVESTSTLDVAGATAVRHPGWNRKRAMERLAKDRAMERSIRERINPTVPRPAPMVSSLPPQKTVGQIAAEMASHERARQARERATELGVVAQRARIEMQRLQPELNARRRQASYRVIEQLLRSM